MLASLLELCGFEPEELKGELPRAQKALDRLGITPEDIELGKKRIRQFYNIELEGVRKALGVQMRELFELALAREEGKEAIIHGTIPQIAGELLTAAALHSDKVVVGFADLVYLDTMGAIFDKFNRVLEAAERLWLSPAGSHCSMCKNHIGLYALDLVPRPDLFISLGRTCDEEPKADELMHEFLGVPVQFINLPQDQWDPEMDFARGRDFIAHDLESCCNRIGQVVGFEITAELLAEARRLRDALTSTLRKGRDLMLYADPIPLNMSSWDLFRRFSMKPLSKANLRRATEAADILYRELEQRVVQGIGVIPKGAPRVMIHGAPHDPSFGYLIEQELGIAAPVTETATYAPDGGFSPSKVETEGKTAFQIWAQRILWKTNTGCLPVRTKGVVEACKRYSLDGVLWNAHYPCRPTAGDVMILKHAIEKEVGIPVLVIEYDLFDSRYHTTLQVATRLESFAEILKSAKKAKPTAV